jgi:hypothetical protein
MLQQPMHLAQVATNSFSNKEHLTKYDINMLENAKKYASRRTVQTLDSIVDNLNTPSLSPSESGYCGDNYFDEEIPNTNNWVERANIVLTTPCAAVEGNV